MDNKQIYLIQNKNQPQNQKKQENGNYQSKYSDQNKNLNESMITTSTSSISVNNKKNLQHTNYKTQKKKIFPNPHAQGQEFESAKPEEPRRKK